VCCLDADTNHDERDRRYEGPDRRGDRFVEVAPVRLTRKYADVIDGVDISDCEVGERLPLPPRDARVLIAEGWAEPAPARERRHRARRRNRRSTNPTSGK
jgi:hypothetical protein